MSQRLQTALAIAMTLIPVSAGFAQVDLSPGAPLGAALRHEGLKQSQASEIATELADRIGGRLSGSPDMRRAYQWAQARLTRLGMQGVRLEDCGEFGLSWQQIDVSARMVTPTSHSLSVVAVPWSVSSEGTVRGSAMLMTARTRADLARYRGRLRGKVVLLGEAPTASSPFDATATRLSERDLGSGAVLSDVRAYYERREGRLLRFAEQGRFTRALTELLQREGVKAVLLPSSSGSGLLSTDDSNAPGGSNWKPGVRPAFPMLRTTLEDYGRLSRLIAAGQDVELELKVEARVTGEREHIYNVIADLPGTHANGEYILIGAHLDSWPGASGAVDNGAGVAIAMEAIRLLKASGTPLRRSVRIVLYAGEEQGLLCSGAYADHYLGTVPRSDTPDQLEIPVVQWRTITGPVAKGRDFDKLSSAFNIDSGSGKFRGVFTGGDNPELAATLRSWLPDLADLGVNHVFDEADWPADQVSFTTLGLPGISFVQDPLDYGRARHSNMDTSERINPDDIAQASTFLAALVAQAANADRLMPRPGSPER